MAATHPGCVLKEANFRAFQATHPGCVVKEANFGAFQAGEGTKGHREYAELRAFAPFSLLRAFVLFKKYTCTCTSAPNMMVRHESEHQVGDAFGNANIVGESQYRKSGWRTRSVLVHVRVEVALTPHCPEIAAGMCRGRLKGPELDF